MSESKRKPMPEGVHVVFETARKRDGLVGVLIIRMASDWIESPSEPKTDSISSTVYRKTIRLHLTGSRRGVRLSSPISDILLDILPCWLRVFGDVLPQWLQSFLKPSHCRGGEFER
jgi:hypothetical protein